MEQLERLIIEPSKKFHPIEPSVIVIVTLDDSDDVPSRQGQTWKKLSSHLDR